MVYSGTIPVQVPVLNTRECPREVELGTKDGNPLQNFRLLLGSTIRICLSTEKKGSYRVKKD